MQKVGGILVAWNYETPGVPNANVIYASYLAWLGRAAFAVTTRCDLNHILMMQAGNNGIKRLAAAE